MALRCPDCGSDSPVGRFYCGVCGSALLPESMIPPAERHSAGGHQADTVAAAEAMHAEAAALPVAVAEAPPKARSGGRKTRSKKTEDEQRYRIVLGDTCAVCKAVSHISFTRDRPPALPISGCQDEGGCHCSLPIFADELQEALNSAQPSLAALAPERGSIVVDGDADSEGHGTATVAGPAGPSADGATASQQAPAVAAAPAPAPIPAAAPEWSRPSPIMQQRQRVLRELTAQYLGRRIQGIRIVTASDCCPICAEVAASVYEPSITPPLPIVGCWHGWACRCMYSEEKLPLDERGLRAIERLELMERERHLRRRKVASGGPRVLHQAAMLVGVAVGMGADVLWHSAGNQGDQVARTAALVLLLAVVVLAVALGAMRRFRPLPSPAWTYMLTGVVVAGLGLQPLIALHLPAIWSPSNLAVLAQTSVSANLSLDAVLTLAPGWRALLISGTAMFLIGLLTLLLSWGDY